MIYQYFCWWYGVGLTQAVQVTLALLERTADFFSIDILFKTWLAPWKNDVLSAQNIALSDQIKLWEQNLVSRLIGFLIRTVVILLGLVALSIGLVLGVISLGIWLLSPFLIFILPILAAWVATR